MMTTTAAAKSRSTAASPSTAPGEEGGYRRWSKSRCDAEQDLSDDGVQKNERDNEEERREGFIDVSLYETRSANDMRDPLQSSPIVLCFGIPWPSDIRFWSVLCRSYSSPQDPDINHRYQHHIDPRHRSLLTL